MLEVTHSGRRHPSSSSSKQRDQRLQEHASQHQHQHAPTNYKSSTSAAYQTGMKQTKNILPTTLPNRHKFRRMTKVCNPCQGKCSTFRHPFLHYGHEDCQMYRQHGYWLGPKLTPIQLAFSFQRQHTHVLK